MISEVRAATEKCKTWNEIARAKHKHQKPPHKEWKRNLPSMVNSPGNKIRRFASWGNNTIASKKQLKNKTRWNNLARKVVRGPKHACGQHRGSPPCSPTKTLLTISYKWITWKSRRCDHHTNRTHNRHKRDARKKMGGANTAAIYQRNWIYVLPELVAAWSAGLINTYLSKATNICGWSTALDAETETQKNTIVCATSSVWLRTNS